MFVEKFNIRWSDVDANRHLANFSFMNYCSQTRMSFLNSHKISLTQLMKWNIGPVILEEKFQYYKEFYPSQNVYVTFELIGKSTDNQMYKIQHKLYDSEGVHHATSTIVGVWLDLVQRKITVPPEEVYSAFNDATFNQNIENLDLSTYKSQSTPPQNIDKSFLQK